MKYFNEAVIVLCKCGKHHRTYGIRTEKRGIDKWAYTWAFPIKENVAKREGYDKTSIKGDVIFTDEFPGCPYCGGYKLTVCSCGHLNCTVLKKGFLLVNGVVHKEPSVIIQENLLKLVWIYNLNKLVRVIICSIIFVS